MVYYANGREGEKIIFQDTIAALATPVGRGGIAVIRISGPQVSDIAQTLLKKLPQPRLACFSTFYNANHEAIDQGIALFFPAPHSFTGDDVLEIQGHGGAMVQELLLQRILQLGARLARPGEFSERAFLNGKIDLIKAEAIADLIDAASEQAVRGALRSLQGEFSKQINQLKTHLIELRIYIEAAIDFPDEEIDFLSQKHIGERLNIILKQAQQLQHDAQQGALLREGMTIVIAGKTNVGKSSLLNALSGKESAIVTAIPGTTRDVLREYIQIDGIPLHIIDTAGLRESADIVEQEGIRRALAEVKRADALLWVVDATISPQESLEEFGLKNDDLSNQQKILIIRNKIDLLNEEAKIDYKNHVTISLSAKTFQGIDLLKLQLKQMVGWQQPSGENNFIARRRHLEALQQTVHHLSLAEQQLKNQGSDLLAEELRLAQHNLSMITGEFRSDDLLGEIFGSFCIGK